VFGVTSNCNPNYSQIASEADLSSSPRIAGGESAALGQALRQLKLAMHEFEQARDQFRKAVQQVER
jgi:hypothetical protein